MTAPGVNFTVKTSNADAIGRALVGLQLRMQDLREPLAEIGASFLASTQRRFEDEQGPGGQGWASTLRGGAILRMSGRLFQSLTYLVGHDFVEIGTNAVYALIHQLGGMAGRGKKVAIEARPYLGNDDADNREALAIINDYMLGGLA